MMTAAKVRMVRPPRNSSVVISVFPFRTAFQLLNRAQRKGFRLIFAHDESVAGLPRFRQVSAQPIKGSVVVDHFAVCRDREIDANLVNTVRGFNFNLSIKLPGEGKDQPRSQPRA